MENIWRTQWITRPRTQNFGTENTGNFKECSPLPILNLKLAFLLCHPFNLGVILRGGSRMANYDKLSKSRLNRCFTIGIRPLLSRISLEDKQDIYQAYLLSLATTSKDLLEAPNKFLVTIARNQTLKHIRNNKRHNYLELVPNYPAADLYPSLDDYLTKLQIFNSLPTNQKDILLRSLHGLPLTTRERQQVSIIRARLRICYQNGEQYIQ